MILPLEDPCGGSAFADTAVRPMSTAQPRLTPLAAGARHQREKLAVLFAFPDQALQVRPGFDARPALDAVFTQAGAEHPRHWRWHEGAASAPHLGLAVDADGQVRALGRGSFGLGDELPRCVLAQPPHWRQAALFALTFAEDLAVLSGSPACPVWLCATLPSHWAPEAALDRPAPWADGLAGGVGAAGGGRGGRPRLVSNVGCGASPTIRACTPTPTASIRSAGRSTMPRDCRAPGCDANAAPPRRCPAASAGC